MERWGVEAQLQPLVGGHRNLAFRTLGLRQDLVFKTTLRSTDAIAWLPRVHDLARQSGFVVPRLIESRNSRLIECGWTCETLVDGTPLSPDDLPGIAPQIAAFHALSADVPQRPGFLSSQALLHADAGGDVDLAAMPAAIAAACREAWRAVSGSTFAVVHGDLHAGNLLRCPDGRIALLDWDECRRDLALFDLGQVSPPGAVEARAIAAWEAACSWGIEPEHARRIAGRI